MMARIDLTCPLLMTSIVGLSLANDEKTQQLTEAAQACLPALMKGQLWIILSRSDQGPFLGTDGEMFAA